MCMGSLGSPGPACPLLLHESLTQPVQATYPRRPDAFPSSRYVSPIVPLAPNSPPRCPCTTYNHPDPSRTTSPISPARNPHTLLPHRACTFIAGAQPGTCHRTAQLRSEKVVPGCVAGGAS